MLFDIFVSGFSFVSWQPIPASFFSAYGGRKRWRRVRETENHCPILQQNLNQTLYYVYRNLKTTNLPNKTAQHLMLLQNALPITENAADNNEEKIRWWNTLSRSSDTQSKGILYLLKKLLIITGQAWINRFVATYWPQNDLLSLYNLSKC